MLLHFHQLDSFIYFSILPFYRRTINQRSVQLWWHLFPQRYHQQDMLRLLSPLCPVLHQHLNHQVVNRVFLSCLPFPKHPVIYQAHLCHLVFLLRLPLPLGVHAHQESTPSGLIYQQTVKIALLRRRRTVFLQNPVISMPPQMELPP